MDQKFGLYCKILSTISSARLFVQATCFFPIVAANLSDDACITAFGRQVARLLDILKWSTKVNYILQNQRLASSIYKKYILQICQYVTRPNLGLNCFPRSSADSRQADVFLVIYEPLTLTIHLVVFQSTLLCEQGDLFAILQTGDHFLSVQLVKARYSRKQERKVFLTASDLQATSRFVAKCNL
jgi:hypothetical protein